MRPIDADAVYPWYIKAFSKEEIGDRAIGPRDLRFSMNDIKANLDNIPTLTQEPAWSPVSKRPKDNGEYLVTRKISKALDVYKIDVLSFDHNLFEVDKYEFAGKKRAGWYDYDSEWGYYEIDDVTAWMPLPKPYKAESEEVKGAYSIPIDTYKVTVDINNLPEMENDPIGEEIERQFKLRAAELKNCTGAKWRADV